MTKPTRINDTERKAVVYQVRHCGCSHCRHLIEAAFGTYEGTAKFWQTEDVLEGIDQ